MYSDSTKINLDTIKINLDAIKLHKLKKLKSFYKATYPTSEAKSLAYDTANEHALTCTRETCSCSQKAVQ